MAAKAQVPDTATYVLTMRDGAMKKVTVPAKWKVTFGALVPGSKNHDQNSGGATALRFYEGTNQQRACFVGVQEFRDDSIGIMERVEDVQTEVVAKKGQDGSIKNFTVSATETKWVNPDLATTQEFKGVPGKLVEYLKD